MTLLLELPYIPLVNTVLCVLLVILRLFWYRKNPDIDTLIAKIDWYLKENLNLNNLNNLSNPDLRSDPNLRPNSNGDYNNVNNDNKSNI